MSENITEETATVEMTEADETAISQLTKAAKRIATKVGSMHKSTMEVGALLVAVEESAAWAHLSITRKAFVDTYLHGTLTESEATQAVKFFTFTTALTEAEVEGVEKLSASVYKYVKADTKPKAVVKAVQKIQKAEETVTAARMKAILNPSVSNAPSVETITEAEEEPSESAQWLTAVNVLNEMLTVRDYVPNPSQLKKLEKILKAAKAASDTK